MEEFDESRRGELVLTVFVLGMYEVRDPPSFFFLAARYQPLTRRI
jgi:hypothetical protein